MISCAGRTIVVDSAFNVRIDYNRDEIFVHEQTGRVAVQLQVYLVTLNDCAVKFQEGLLLTFEDSGKITAGHAVRDFSLGGLTAIISDTTGKVPCSMPAPDEFMQLQNTRTELRYREYVLPSIHCLLSTNH